MKPISVNLSYAIITPARNEGEFIEETIRSVVVQTVKPVKWIIVSDGSTDETDAIVARYAEKYPWIELMRMPERRDRNFRGKAHAVNTAYELLRSEEFQVIVILDADISVDKDHFAYLLARLSENPFLGVVGTPFQESSGEVYDYKFVSLEHVSGACQVFRRKCFEDIRGYIPLPGGGVDHVAVITARMKGWRTRTFTEMVSHHHRKMGSAEHGVYSAWFRTGSKDYMIGGHPLWEFTRVLRQITQKPLFVRGLALGLGYLWPMIRRVKGLVPREVQIFHRQEQMSRFKELLRLRRSLSSKGIQRPA